MEFDINVILVPVVLVFLVVYLADKFVLKQHKLVAKQNQLTDHARTHLTSVEKELADALVRFGHDVSPEEFISHAHTPEVLKNAHSAYQEARRSLRHAQGGETPATEMVLVRWAYEYLPILLVIIVVRSFIAEPFNIPSSSMVPTLYTGDFILVNKASYGLRLPLNHAKILSTGEPKHGDVVVFRYPQNPKRYYIKRVIGLPGDVVTFDNDKLSINGESALSEPITYDMPATLNAKIMPAQIGNQTLSDAERADYGSQEEKHARYYRETLGKHSYNVRYLGDINSSQAGAFLQQQSPEVIATQGHKWQITIPEGQYFVMGDNRDRSEDSRFWGLVPESYLAGKATYIWMHKEPGLRLPTFGRVGAID